MYYKYKAFKSITRTELRIWKTKHVYTYKAFKSTTRTELLSFSLLIAFIFIGKPLGSHSKSHILSMRFEPVGAASAFGEQRYAHVVGAFHFFDHESANGVEFAVGNGEIEFVVHL